MSHIKKIHESSHPLKFQRITKLLKLLSNFIAGSEENGTAGVTQQRSLLKGELINKITVINSCNQNQSYGRKFELYLYSNTTIFDLRNIIGVLTNVPAEVIKLNRMSTKKEIKDQENGKTLGDLEFKHNEELIAVKKSLDYVDKQPLTVKGGELTPEARQVFEDWFNGFSKEGLMRKEDTQAFIKSCTSDDCSINDPRIQKLFAYDADNDGAVTKDEFVDFYRQSSIQ